MALVHKILVATDFSPAADNALNHGIDLARTFGAPLVITHVYAPPVLAVPDGVIMVTAFDLADLLVKLQAGLDAAARRARDAGVAAVETALVEGTPWHEIVATADARKCDLIALGTHGRGVLAHALLGSVAEKVVRKAHCPVLTVHAAR
jgi:nucleotide-binding universal stress UspA family protein